MRPIILAYFLLLPFGSLQVAETLGAEEPRKTVQKLGSSSAIRVELRESADQTCFAVCGLEKLGGIGKLSPAELEQLFSIRVQSVDLSDAPLLLGKYQIVDEELQFIARFPLSRSVKYHVHLASKLTGLSSDEDLEFSTSRPASSAVAKVTEVFPSANELPENVLKFYIHFSVPMSRGEAYRRIHLIEGDREVEDPFLELGEELWNAEQTRFTLFIHPGRIKRGVKPREDKGPPMTSGKQYTLRIDPEWLSAERQPLTAAYEKHFKVANADVEQPHPQLWKIFTPKHGSLDPVELEFNEPLDHGMLMRVLTIHSITGDEVAGKIEVRDHETRWSFGPITPWRKGEYQIVVATNLEDRSGNSLARPFEVEMNLPTETQAPPSIAIEFVVD